MTGPEPAIRAYGSPAQAIVTLSSPKSMGRPKTPPHSPCGSFLRSGKLAGVRNNALSRDGDGLGGDQRSGRVEWIS